MYPIFLAIVSCVTTSYAEPIAVSRKQAKSASEGFSAPSAILLEILVTALCN